MKKLKIFLLISIITAILATSTIALAEQTPNVSGNTISTNETQAKEILDPIKRIENRIADIQKSAKDGKITQQQAEDKIGKLKQRIAEIEAFNKLTVPEKRNKLINNITIKLNKK